MSILLATSSSTLIFKKNRKYFADFNFHGLILTTKFRENWTMRKFPFYGTWITALIDANKYINQDYSDSKRVSVKVISVCKKMKNHSSLCFTTFKH